MTDCAMTSRPAHDANAATTASGVAATRVLGVPVSTINLKQAVSIIRGWNRDRQAHYVCIRDVHGVMRALDDPKLMEIHNQAGLVTPDGMPLYWMMRLRGYRDTSRVCGADLVAALCDASQETGARHYFFGGKPGVAERAVAQLTSMFPRLQIAGISTPPFRPLTPEEDAKVVEEISATKPDIIWVGLSTPKQEFWMSEHVGRIPGATMLGVGAAFDFYAGDVKRAPRWMHETGFEWLHRLWSEPRRLWRRYLVLAPKFIFLVLRRELM